MKKPRILVTGASGFIGSHLVRRLVEQDYPVVATSRTQPAYLRHPPFDRVRFVASDLTRLETLKSPLEGVERVYHFGALFDFAATNAQLEATNVEGTRALGLAAVQAGVREFVHCSSGAVYGIHYGPRRCVESDAPLPLDKYARTKWASEQAIFALHGRNGMRTMILRPGAVYGPGAKYGDAVALRLLKMGLLVGVPGWRDASSSHLHVEDMADAAIHLSETPSAWRSEAREAHEVAYNLCDQTPRTGKDLLVHASRRVKVGLVGFHPHLRLPLFLLRALAWGVEGGARALGVRPLFEKDSIDYIGRDHCLSPEKALAAGVRLSHPDTLAGLDSVIDWYNQTDWAVFREPDPTRLSLPPSLAPSRAA